MSSGSRLVAAPSSDGEARAALAQHLEDLGGRADHRLAGIGADPGAPRAARGGRRGTPPRSAWPSTARTAGASTASARRGEAQPADLAVVAQPVEPAPARSAAAGRPSSSGSQATAAASKPWSCSSTASSPASPASWVPGATCCQRSRKRMKSWAVAGSTPPRRVRREYECMRASSRRATHSVSAASGPVVALQREAARARGRRARRAPARSVRVVAAARSSTVVMPRDLEVPAQHRGDRALRRRRSARCASSARSVVHHSGSPSVLEHRRRAHAPRARRTAAASRSRAGDDERRQQVVEVVGRRRVGRDLAVHLLDRVGIERADGGEVDGEAAPQRDRVGAAVLQLLVVEERVGPRGDDLVREHRRLGGVDAVHGDLTRLDALEQRAHAVDVERLVQRVVDRLAHEHVVGDLDRAGDVLLAGRRLREHRGHEVVGLHALDRRRVAPPVAEAQHHERAVEVPAPPGLEHRRVEDGVLERVLDRRAADVARHLLEREAVVRPEREHDGVVAGRGLQLEVERAAELLAQREPERAVDAPAERRVHDELHPAGVVEEALEHEPLLGGHRPEHRAPDREVVDDHGGGVGVDPGGLAQPVRGRRRDRRRRGTRRPRCAAPRPRPTARRCGPAPRPSRTGSSGAASPASRTRTTPGSTWRICHECVPSRKMSPAIDSTAQSSLTVPMNVSSGSATTR